MYSEQNNSPQILICFIRQYILSLFRSFLLSDRSGFPAVPAFTTFRLPGRAGSLGVPAFWSSVTYRWRDMFGVRAPQSHTYRIGTAYALLLAN